MVPLNHKLIIICIYILYMHKQTIILFVFYSQWSYIYIFLTFNIFWWVLVKLYPKPYKNSMTHILYTSNDIITTIWMSKFKNLINIYTQNQMFFLFYKTIYI